MRLNYKKYDMINMLFIIKTIKVAATLKKYEIISGFCNK